MKVLVTGNAGFIGSWITDALIEKGYTVYGMDNLSGGLSENINKDCQHFTVDLCDGEKVNNAVGIIQPEVVFHCAADATEGRSQFTPVHCVKNNILASTNLLRSCIRRGTLKRFIYFSSMSVYGDQTAPFSEDMKCKPVDVYGVCKTSVEEIIKILSDVHDFSYVILRPHNVIGERQALFDPARNVLGIWTNMLLKKKPFYIYGDGEQLRSFSYIGDMVEPIIKCITEPVHGEIINLGAKDPVSINYLAYLVMNTFDKNWVRNELGYSHIADRPREVKIAYCTVDKSMGLLGFKDKTPLVDAIGKFVMWAKEHYPKGVETKYTDLELVNHKTPVTWTWKLI